jgi:hypothetical protein
MELTLDIKKGTLWAIWKIKWMTTCLHPLRSTQLLMMVRNLGA